MARKQKLEEDKEMQFCSFHPQINSEYFKNNQGKGGILTKSFDERQAFYQKRKLQGGVKYGKALSTSLSDDSQDLQKSGNGKICKLRQTSDIYEACKNIRKLSMEYEYKLKHIAKKVPTIDPHSDKNAEKNKWQKKKKVKKRQKSKSKFKSKNSNLMQADIGSQQSFSYFVTKKQSRKQQSHNEYGYKATIKPGFQRRKWIDREKDSLYLSSSLSRRNSTVKARKFDKTPIQKVNMDQLRASRNNKKMNRQRRQTMDKYLNQQMGETEELFGRLESALIKKYVKFKD